MLNMEELSRVSELRGIFSVQQLQEIIHRTKKTEALFIKYDVKPASEGISGFLGDHFKVTLYFREQEYVEKVYLFVKTKPTGNAPKCEFIDENNFFRRESLTFDIFDQMPEEEFSGSSPWGVKAIVHSHDILVLRDLSVDGYTTFPARDYLDYQHVLLTATALARFHAAFANYHTEINSPRNNYEYFRKEPQFFDCPWLHAATKTTKNFLKEFSTNVKLYPPNLEELLTKWCIDACASIKEYENTLNVIIHKDLWANNILFRYVEGEPCNAVLIDFQCARFAPPAFDLMIFLYYTTSRRFRERHELEVFHHYFTVFSNSVNEITTNRLNALRYDEQAFLVWCEKARLAGMVVPLGIHPFIMMSPVVAQKAFDDPQLHQKYYFEDRSDPVVEYARGNDSYKNRLLEVFEEFVERNLKK